MSVRCILCNSDAPKLTMIESEMHMHDDCIDELHERMRVHKLDTERWIVVNSGVELHNVGHVRSHTS